MELHVSPYNFCSWPNINLAMMEMTRISKDFYHAWLRMLFTRCEAISINEIWLPISILIVKYVFLLMCIISLVAPPNMIAKTNIFIQSKTSENMLNRNWAACSTEVYWIFISPKYFVGINLLLRLDDDEPIISQILINQHLVMNFATTGVKSYKPKQMN